MLIPDGLLPTELLWLSHALVAGLLWQALHRAPWRQCWTLGLAPVFGGGVVALLLLWNFAVSLRPGLGFHFLGVTVFTLMFGWALAVWGVGLAALLLAWQSGQWQTLSLNLLLFGVVPVSVSYAVYWLVARYLPCHVFIYIFLCAFGGAMLAAAVTVLALVALLIATDIYAPAWIAAQYLPFLPLYLFPEGVLNGMLTTVLVGVRPQWLKTFDEAALQR